MGINIDDLKILWTFNIESFSDFFFNFSAAAHTLRVNCDEMAGEWR